jgi:hypothetical protein
MPTAKPAEPAAIAADLAPLIKADPVAVAIVLAGYFQAIRENDPGHMPALKTGVDPLRIELEKYRRWYLEQRDTADPDPTAALLAAGAALLRDDGQ